VSRIALAVLVAALAGCGGGSDADVEARLTIVVPDNNIREEGSECAGARPFRAIHRGTAFTVEDGSGAVVAEGELPAGVATNADPAIEWEDDLIPTVCTFDVEVGLPEQTRYTLILPEAVPLEFDRAQLNGDEPLRLVLTG
jgi:hypothetical protein